MSRLAVVLWVAAGAILAWLADVAQVSLTTGGLPIVRLAVLALLFYLGLALILGAVASLAAGRLRPSALAAVGMTSFIALFALAFVNIVYLPSIREPITIAANIALGLLFAYIAYRLSRSSILERFAPKTWLPALISAIALFAGLTIATGETSEKTLTAKKTIDDVPNVFVITIDSLRVDRTGLVAGEKSLTPALDELASKGWAFRRAYAQASWTKPSVASLFTSRFPGEHGANLRRDRLPDNGPNMAESFARAGYRTAVFSANPWIAPAFGFDRGVEYFFESDREPYSRLVILLKGLKAIDRVVPGKVVSTLVRYGERAVGLGDDSPSNCDRDTILTNAFDQWLREAPEIPAFAYFHFMSPHIPYDPPNRNDNFANEDQVALLTKTHAIEPERRAELVGLYDETVRHGDHILRDVMRSIEAVGAADKTVFVITADHGEEFYEHGRWGHGKSLYDEVVNIPLVFSGPGFSPETQREGPAMLVDILPSLAGVGQLRHDAAWRGANLAEISARRTAFAELIREGGLSSVMLFRDGKKYLETVHELGDDPVVELFDTAKDPTEKRNTAQAYEPEWKALLAAKRSQSAGSPKSTSNRTKRSKFSEADRERLRQLGYDPDR